METERPEPLYSSTNLKIARKSANISREKLAEKIGTTSTILKGWEDGTRRPNKHNKEILESFIRDASIAVAPDEKRAGATTKQTERGIKSDDPELVWAMNHFIANRDDKQLVAAFKAILHRHASNLSQ